MSHPIMHAKSAAKRWGGTWEDYIHYKIYYCIFVMYNTKSYGKI